MVTMLHTLVLVLVTSQVLSSVYSGRENICNLPECECQLDTVICTCDQDSSFQVDISGNIVNKQPTLNVIDMRDEAVFLSRYWSHILSFESLSFIEYI